MFRVPPNTLPLVIYIGIFCYWVLLHYNMSFKKIAGGLLIVLSDGMVHFLKIEEILTNLLKLSCGFKCLKCHSFHIGDAALQIYTKNRLFYETVVCIYR